MTYAVVQIDCAKIFDWSSFHKVFAEAFGFPKDYVYDMNAWIDCLSFIDDPKERVTEVYCDPGEIITIELLDVSNFVVRCPAIFAAFVECSSFVNWRRLESNQGPLIALAFFGGENDV